MEPEQLSTLDYIVYVTGAAVVAALGWLGKNKKADPQPTAMLSGALMDNRAVDPLVRALEEQAAATTRLCELMEKEVGLRQSSVEENRRLEERKAMALAIADQVREDILAEMRAEIQRTPPAPMPTVRKPRGPE